jgi:AcrR family transcriptional regulator
VESYNEAALVAAAVDGMNLAGIANAAGVSVSTVQRRLRTPEMRRQISDARSRLRDEAVGKLAQARGRALERLSEMVADEDSNVALRAIALVLTNLSTPLES